MILLLYLVDLDAMASTEKAHLFHMKERKSQQSECEKAIPEAPFHPSNWLAMGHTSKANSPEISVFLNPSCHHVCGGIENKECPLCVDVVY